MPSSTTSLAPSVRSRISWPILVSARRISSGPSTGLDPVLAGAGPAVPLIPAINRPPSPPHGTGLKGRRTAPTYQHAAPAPGRPAGSTHLGHRRHAIASYAVIDLCGCPPDALSRVS